MSSATQLFTRNPLLRGAAGFLIGGLTGAAAAGVATGLLPDGPGLPTIPEPVTPPPPPPAPPPAPPLASEPEIAEGAADLRKRRRTTFGIAQTLLVRPGLGSGAGRLGVVSGLGAGG